MKALKLDHLINLTNSLKSISYWMVKTCLTSVDFTEINEGQLNIIRYLICSLELFLMILGFMVLSSLAIFDSLYILIDNEYFPDKIRILAVLALSLLLLSIISRFDFLQGEWKTHLSSYKFFYFLQFDIRSKHGLTKGNYKKLSILAKFIEIVFLKGCVPLICVSIIVIFTYIFIKSNKFLLQFLALFFIYNALMVASTIALLGSLAFMTLYYYKLLFDQINNKIEKIYKRSNSTIVVADQKRLLWLVKQHDLKGQQVNQLNIIFRRTNLVLFIVLALIQIIPLNLYLQTNVLFQKILYLIYLFTSFVFGLGNVFFFSMQIKAAHKPYKTIYCILSKQKLNLYFKWKVI